MLSGVTKQFAHCISHEHTLFNTKGETILFSFFYIYLLISLSLHLQITEVMHQTFFEGLQSIFYINKY